METRSGPMYMKTCVPNCASKTKNLNANRLVTSEHNLGFFYFLVNYILLTVQKNRKRNILMHQRSNFLAKQ